MKNFLKIAALSILISMSVYGFAQNDKDSLGLPGDNLDLTAVLNIFKQSTSVEDFEKKLNAADTKVNNLDLNHDGQVDYIRVIESGKDNTHELVLQVPVSKSESQDVAVIQLEKKEGNLAHVQIVGDETLYGKDYIIEPQDETKEATKTATTQTTQPVAKKQDDTRPVDDVYAAPGSFNNNSPAVVNNNNYYGSSQPNVYVNVWSWPCVPMMFGPGYGFWVSPWYWGYYPGWWSPWAPYGWYGYHMRMMGYGWYGYYRHSYYNHMRGPYNGYYGHRVSSPYVQKTRNSQGSINGPRYTGAKQINGNPQKFNQPVQQKNAGNQQNVTPKQTPVFKPQRNQNWGGGNNGGGGFNRGGGSRGNGGNMGGGHMGGGGRRR